MRKIVFILAVLLLSGCWSTRPQLLNMSTWWGGTPDYVKVAKGDTLYSISRQYDVPIRDIIEVNKLRPPYVLMIGQTLRLPTAQTHTVAKGDTLYSISRRYNVDRNTLSRQNNLQYPYTLSVGQKLEIPGAISSSSSTAHASSGSSNSTSSYSSSSSSSSSSSAQVSQYRKTKFAWPLKGQILSPYGSIAKGRNNDGINIKATNGAAINAADKGTVAYAGSELKGFGNLILIKHDDGWVTAYAHNDRLFVKKGQRVAKGEKIAAAGTTGGVTTPQLHFETRCGKKPLNPVAYLEK